MAWWMALRGRPEDIAALRASPTASSSLQLEAAYKCWEAQDPPRLELPPPAAVDDDSPVEEAYFEYEANQSEEDAFGWNGVLGFVSFGRSLRPPFWIGLSRLA